MGPESSARAEAAPGTIPPAKRSPAVAIVVPRENAATARWRSTAADPHLDKTPARNPGGLELNRNGWIYDCMECHTLLGARWRYDRPLNEHRDIVLEHGNNRFCLNCHHPANRNAFADYDGAEIAQDDVVQLCAKCHGTIFRDWQAGVHGRRNGYWNAQAGTQTRLACIECHAPHAPKFPDMKPLAPLRYPARAAGAQHDVAGPSASERAKRFASFASYTHEAKALAASATAPNFDPKPETRNPKPRLARSAPAAP